MFVWHKLAGGQLIFAQLELVVEEGGLMSIFVLKMQLTKTDAKTSVENVAFTSSWSDEHY